MPIQVQYQQSAIPPPQPAVAPSAAIYLALAAVVWKTTLSTACLATSGPVLPPVQPDPPSTGWMAPLSEPVLPAAYKQTLKVTVAAIPNAAPTAVVESWFAPLSDPTRLLLSHATRQQDLAFVALVTSTPPVVVLESWFAPLSDPIRISRTTPQQSIAFVPLVTPPPQSWFAALSAPVVTKSLHVSQQQSLAYVAFTPSTGISWFTPFSQPVWSRPGLLAGLNQDLARNIFPLPQPVVPPAPVSVYNWGWQNLALPRFPFGFPSMLQMFTGSLGPIVPIPNPPLTDAIYTVSGGPVDDRYPASGVSWTPPTGLGTQKRTL